MYNVTIIKINTLLVRQLAKSLFISVTDTLSLGLFGPLTEETTVAKSRPTDSLKTGSWSPAE